MNWDGIKEFVEPSGFKNLVLSQTSIIDVRAPIEFNQGSIPGSVNLPILTDSERHSIGTTYKQKGQDAAVKLGHELVSGAIKEERIQAWLEHVRQFPDCVITCFRGGMRSGIAQQWLKEAGMARPRVAGGFKALRQFLLDEIFTFADKEKMVVISGSTGSGKTKLLQELIKSKRVLDLEGAAHHRGSAFGGYLEGQPSQINFENKLALDILHVTTNFKDGGPVILEDESRTIGRSIVPTVFFEKLQASPVVIVQESLEKRVQSIFEDYILDSPIGQGDQELGLRVYSGYINSLLKIQKKLGGARTQEVMADLKESLESFKNDPSKLEINKVWIKKLLDWYYDPLYKSSLERRDPRILFCGTRQECFEYLLGRNIGESGLSIRF